MCSYDQSLVTVAFLWEKISQRHFYNDLTWKAAFFEGWSWFKFNNFGLVLRTNLKCYDSVAKGSKLKVRRFWGPVPSFVEVTGEKLVGGASPPSILNGVKKIPVLKVSRNSFQLCMQICLVNIHVSLLSKDFPQPLRGLSYFKKTVVL